MKKKTLFLLAGAAALGAYSAIEGIGPFNRIKFKEQHDAVARYVGTHYPGALYSPITETKNGWMTILRSLKYPPVVIYLSRTDSGDFVFREEQPTYGENVSS